MSTGRFNIDESGTIHVKNESAYWIPELTIMEVVHGTTFIVTGSYEGNELMTKKLERIMARKAVEFAVESHIEDNEMNEESREMKHDS